VTIYETHDSLTGRGPLDPGAFGVTIWISDRRSASKSAYATRAEAMGEAKAGFREPTLQQRAARRVARQFLL